MVTRTRVKQPEQLKLKGPSSTLDNRALFPQRDRGQVQPHGHKRLFKFHRIGGTKCSTSPDTKKTLPAGKGHAYRILSPVMVHVNVLCKTWSSSEKSVAVRYGCRREEMKIPKVHKGRREPQDRTIERPYLDELLKSVTSGVKSVLILPKQGCLKWPYGTMSEPP